MKRLHRDDLYMYSRFDEARNIDFNSVFWAREAGNVLIDPLPLSAHDRAQIDVLGGVALVVITNSDHVRAAAEIAQLTGASVAGPVAEKDGFPVPCDRWIGDGELVVEGLLALALDGSKTPGELALLLDGSTLITGDLVRVHSGGRLHRLPDAKLSDAGAARASIARLAELPAIDAVIVGDGWPVFRDGSARLRELASGF